MIDVSISLGLSFDKEVRCLNSRRGLSPIFNEKVEFVRSCQVERYQLGHG